MQCASDWSLGKTNILDDSFLIESGPGPGIRDASLMMEAFTHSNKQTNKKDLVAPYGFQAFTGY